MSTHFTSTPRKLTEADILQLDLSSNKPEPGPSSRRSALSSLSEISRSGRNETLPLQASASSSHTGLLSFLDHMDAHMNILVTGHSWVSDMERAFTPDLVPGATVVFRPFPGIKLKQLYDKLPELLDETFTHMLVYIIISEAYTIIKAFSDLEDYWVTIADFTYTNEDFARRFSEFTIRCSEINYGLKVILIIPPVLDLVHYNQVKFHSCPRRIQDLFNRDPVYSDKILHLQAKKMYQLTSQLRSDTYQWYRKYTYPFMYSVDSITYQKKKATRFMNGELYTFGPNGFLRDGLHPSPLLCVNFWKRLYREGIFTYQPNPLLNERVYMRTAAYTALKVNRDPRATSMVSTVEIINLQGASLEPIYLDEQEYQPGPLRSQAISPRDVTMSAEPEEPNRSLVLKSTSLDSRGDPSEVIHSRGIFPIRYIGDPHTFGNREENTNNVRKRAREPRRVVPRTAPYKLDTVQVRKHKSEEKNVPSLPGSMLRESSPQQQWEKKFRDFVTFSVGFFSGHGEELSNQEVIERIKRLCN